jgi:hypothetical protein
VNRCIWEAVDFSAIPSRYVKKSYLYCMEKVVKIYSLKSQPTDRAYWMTKSSAERISAIEFLRMQLPDYENQLSKGLQRVCRVIRKA